MNLIDIDTIFNANNVIRNIIFYFFISVNTNAGGEHDQSGPASNDQHDPAKTVVIIVFALCILTIILMLWYIRRRRDVSMGEGGGKDCEKAKYKECPVKEEDKTSSNSSTEGEKGENQRTCGTLEALAQDAGDENRPIIKNQVTANVENVPSKGEDPKTQTTEVPKPTAEPSQLLTKLQQGASELVQESTLQATPTSKKDNE